MSVSSLPDSVKKDLESKLDEILLEYSKSYPKKKISKLPRVLAKFLAYLPLETILNILKNKIK